MSLKIDLHLHTNESDGVLTPEALMQAVASSGLDYFSVTDHDTVAMYERHGSLLEKFGKRVIAGVEVSTNTGEREVHILAYGMPVDARALREILLDRTQIRRMRAERIVDKLAEQGVPISMDDVDRQAQGKMVGRPHIARALIALGVVPDISQAFERYLGTGCSAFEPSTLLKPADAIRAINESGGVPVLAHPTRNAAEELLDDLLKAGLRGIEAYSTSHTAHDVERFRALARKHDLVMTAGTDFHGPTEANPSPGVEVERADLEGFLALV
jgi:3',5'-nucleoside bisphosphate phosphatase